MQTDVVHGGDGSVDVGHTDHFVAAEKFFGFIALRKFGSRSNFYSRNISLLAIRDFGFPLR